MCRSITSRLLCPECSVVHATSYREEKCEAMRWQRQHTGEQDIRRCDAYFAFKGDHAKFFCYDCLRKMFVVWEGYVYSVSDLVREEKIQEDSRDGGQSLDGVDVELREAFRWAE